MMRASSDLSEGHGGDQWHGAWGDIQGRDARDALGVQGACLEVGHVEEVHDVLLYSAVRLPAAPSADEPSSLHTSAAPCGRPVALSKAAASGAPAKKKKKEKNSCKISS